MDGRPMTVQIKRGDLLRQETDAIVNTVNCVGVMGKGIALQFKHRWPQNFREYEHACRLGAIKLGRVFVFDAGGLVKPNFIINFPTKRHWREKSKIEYIEAGLKDLVSEVRRLGIKSIAIPPLGCGNGGLRWTTVRDRIVEAFNSLPDVAVLLFEPKGAPPAQEMVNRTNRPRMTAARAAIVKIISIYREMQYGLSRIEVQKLVYLLEAAGQPLNLEFGENKYGPYSDKLRHVLKAMDRHYIKGVGDHASESEIVVAPQALPEAEKFLANEGEDSARDRVDRIAELIEGFESPYGMELLATVHWVAHHEPFARDLDAAIAAVHAWNDRKRLLLKKPHIAIAWQRLEEGGWLHVDRNPPSKIN
jgi:O-acetyl-ADP-ribose deacetylase (regulator of RNase III)